MKAPQLHEIELAAVQCGEELARMIDPDLVRQTITTAAKQGSYDVRTNIVPGKASDNAERFGLSLMNLLLLIGNRQNYSLAVDDLVAIHRHRVKDAKANEQERVPGKNPPETKGSRPEPTPAPPLPHQRIADICLCCGAASQPGQRCAACKLKTPQQLVDQIVSQAQRNLRRGAPPANDREG